MKKRVPAQQGRCEIQIARSRFIASAAPAFSVEQARRFIQEIRAEFPDAAHHVPAYLIGHGSSVISHCQDDREPSGTAGRPLLSVLQGSGLGDIVLVVTRYFGGTKLGTGGLVRAYSEAARRLLQELPRAEKRLVHTVLLSCPYKSLEPVRRAVHREQGQILKEDFAAQVSLTLRLPASRYPSFQQAIAQLSNASWKPKILQTSEESFAPRRQGAK